METTHHADALLVKIREAKEAQDLTNEDLAEMTGINETTISRIISGAGKRPSFDTLVTMAAALHISVDKILYALLPDAEITPKARDSTTKASSRVMLSAGLSLFPLPL